MLFRDLLRIAAASDATGGANAPDESCPIPPFSQPRIATSRYQNGMRALANRMMKRMAGPRLVDASRYSLHAVQCLDLDMLEIQKPGHHGKELNSTEWTNYRA